jgi:hypothetical protein
MYNPVLKLGNADMEVHHQFGILISDRGIDHTADDALIGMGEREQEMPYLIRRFFAAIGEKNARV